MTILDDDVDENVIETVDQPSPLHPILEPSLQVFDQSLFLVFGYTHYIWIYPIRGSIKNVFEAIKNLRLFLIF